MLLSSSRSIRSLGWLTVSTVIWTTVLTVLYFLGTVPEFDTTRRDSRNTLYNNINDTRNFKRTDSGRQTIYDTDKAAPKPHRCVIANGTKLRLISKDMQDKHNTVLSDDGTEAGRKLPADQSYGNKLGRNKRRRSGGDGQEAGAEDAGEENNVKVILRWTKFYGRSWGVPQGRHIFEDLKCPVSQCSISDDKSSVQSAHAILVHIRDVSDPSQLPKYRSKDQRWIFYNLESPYHTETNLSKFNGLFNWTSTYSSESDIPSPYGTYEPFDKYTLSLNNNETNRTKRSLSQRHPTKSRLGAWFVTNCKAKNNRKEYVEALQKNMLIDIYGFCGNYKCHDRETCLDMLKQKYKFYIAFENSNCREYISEKFWYNALEHNILPVVMGADKDEYEKFTPPHSFIHVDDFPSAKDLARYLKLLHKDVRLYNEYFRWQNQGTASAHINYLPTKSRYWCDLCKALHNTELPEQVHWNLDKWWSVEEQCW